MSWYRKDEFEYEFARRTLVNLEFIEDAYRKEKAKGLTDQEIDSVYEVTQLINSFIGFLVIPRADFFTYLSDDISFDRESEANKILKKLSMDKDNYQDTYRKCVKKSVGRKNELEYYEEFEVLTPKILILRLRNAISHNRIEITPIKGYHDTSITGFIFEDSCPLYGIFENGIFIKTGNKDDKITQRFMIKLTVNEIRILVLSLCKLMLKQY